MTVRERKAELRRRAARLPQAEAGALFDRFLALPEVEAAEKYRIAAICAAPTLLARAGLLRKGARCVCYPGMEGELSAAGAVPQMERPTVVDGNLVTGRGPGAAFDFGLTLVEVLAGADAARTVAAGLVYGV